MKYKVNKMLVLAGVLVFTTAAISFAACKNGKDCGTCSMAGLTVEQRTEIQKQLKELKDSGATGEEIKAFKARIAKEYGVQMPEGQKGKGRNKKQNCKK